MGKNVKAIEKIIKELSLRDYKARCARLTEAQNRNISIEKKTLSDYDGYSLAADTMEAIETKHDYQNGNITEEAYKPISSSLYILRFQLVL